MKRYVILLALLVGGEELLSAPAPLPRPQRRFVLKGRWWVAMNGADSFNAHIVFGMDGSCLFYPIEEDKPIWKGKWTLQGATLSIEIWHIDGWARIDKYRLEMVDETTFDGDKEYGQVRLKWWKND